ncbi:hypothetical protein GE09DRAFT_1207093 [Coniochaeta sp. 2T2.1]|nr:hypothetical protein GE09DRAFT_1207093 [Coniochaeta sp. 2T2.1]
MTQHSTQSSDVDDDDDDGVELKVASFGGHGTLEALAVTRILEDHGINCCICGTSALIYYGAGRVRLDWEICVPSTLAQEAEALLKSEDHSRDYMTLPPWPIPWPGSLAHTYTRFRGRDVDFYFVLVPSDDVHLPLEPSNLQRSHHGLPYPRLDVLIQSFLDSNNGNSLGDVVDGSDVSEEWGYEHLDLDGTTDEAWVARKNKAIIDSLDPLRARFGGGIPVYPLQKRDMWKAVVKSKLHRLGWTTPESLFLTRFRLRGSPDPWLRPRDCC